MAVQNLYLRQVRIIENSHAGMVEKDQDSRHQNEIITKTRVTMGTNVQNFRRVRVNHS